MIKIDGYDEAIIGPAMVWTEDGALNQVLVYNGEWMRGIIMRRDGLTSEEAREFIEFNIEGAYMGPHTAVIVWPDDEWSIYDEDIL